MLKSIQSFPHDCIIVIVVIVLFIEANNLLWRTLYDFCITRNSEYVEIAYLKVCLNSSLQIHIPLRNCEVLAIKARCLVKVE